MIKAIQTEYDGYRFRSRLEARWATFFNYANIPYKYEVEGFVTEKGEWHLPDFYLPECDLYVEVKGNTAPLTKAWLLDRAKALPKAESCRGEHFHGLMLVGDIPNVAAMRGDYGNGCGGLDYDCFWPTIIPSRFESLEKQDICLAGFGMYYKNNRPWVIGGPSGLITYPWGYFDISDEGSMPEAVYNAYRKARSARFEHGESP